MTTAVEGYNVQGGPAIPTYLVNSAMPAPSSSESHIGLVGGLATKIDLIPTLSVAGAYIAGDYVGESSAHLTFPDAARVIGGTGLIKSAMLIDGDKQSVGMEMWMFDEPITPPLDNAAWSISDADAAKCIGIFVFDTWFASALNSVAQVHTPMIGFKCRSDVKNLYGALVTRGAPTFTSLKLTVRINVLQD